MTDAGFPVYRRSMPARAPSGRASSIAVLFADISGSTPLYAERGDTVAFELVAGCLETMSAAVDRFGGRVVKRLGDAVLAVFDKAEDAVRAAGAMQESFHTSAGDETGDAVRIRTGISSGSAVLDDDDVYGDVVNVAARLVALAGPGEILLSERVHGDLPSPLRESARLLDQLLLRGRPLPTQVYQYLWNDDDATLGSKIRPPASAAVLEVAHGSRVFVVEPERPRLTVGRAASNDVVLDDSLVSRHHLEISFHDDKFRLKDSSTNGTFVRMDTGEQCRVKREQITLSGSGTILLGPEEGPALRYRVLLR